MAKPRYEIDERVKICGWGGSDFGSIVDIKEVYHHRLGEYTNGYQIKYDKGKPLFTMIFVPEGYLRKLAKGES